MAAPQIDLPSETMKSITPDELIRSALDGKPQATSGYDAILWKIRAGYVAILYGALGLLLNKDGDIPHFQGPSRDR